MKNYKLYIVNIALVFSLLLILNSCKDEDINSGGDDPTDIMANCEVLKDGMMQNHWDTRDTPHPILWNEINRISQDLQVPTNVNDVWEPEATKDKYELLLDRIRKCEDLGVESVCFACDKFDKQLSVFRVTANAYTANNDREVVIKYVTMKTDITGNPIHVVDISYHNPTEKKEDDNKEIKANCELISKLLLENRNPNFPNKSIGVLKEEINRLASDLPTTDIRSIDKYFHEKSYGVLLDRLRECGSFLVEDFCYACDKFEGWNSVFRLSIKSGSNIAYPALFFTVQTGNQNDNIRVVNITYHNPLNDNDTGEQKANCEAISTVLSEIIDMSYPPAYQIAINNLALDLRPLPTHNDPIGHHKNLELLVARINKCENLEAKINCYACLKSLPMQSVITISGLNAEGEKAWAEVRIVTSKEDVLKVAGLGNTSYTKKDEDPDKDPDDKGLSENECASIVKTAMYDVMNMAPNNVPMMIEVLNKYLSDLKPMRSNTDNLGHEHNLKIFVERLNSCNTISAEINCYACMESYPPQSSVSMKIATSDNSMPILAKVNISTNPNDVMTVVSVSYEK